MSESSANQVQMTASTENGVHHIEFRPPLSLAITDKLPPPRPKHESFQARSQRLTYTEEQFAHFEGGFEAYAKLVAKHLGDVAFSGSVEILDQ